MALSTKMLTAALLAAGTMVAVPATAAPLSAPMGLSNNVASPVETVQWRRGGFRGGFYRGGGYRRGWGPGFGVGAGLAAGAIIGGVLAAPYYAPGYYGPGYDYGPGYAPGYVAVEPAGPDPDEVAYCQQQFRSYNPATGTYRGYDGLDHPCP